MTAVLSLSGIAPSINREFLLSPSSSLSPFVRRRDYGYWDYGYSSCGASGFDCQDPEAPVDCPTPSPASSAGYTTSTTGWYLSPTTDDGYGYGYNGCTW